MNSLTRIMSYDKTKNENQEKCNCECVSTETVKLENQIVEYPKLSEEEIEKIISERYSDKDEKTKTFIRKALRKHGDKYDYSNVVYIKSIEQIKLICKNNHYFLQKPRDHIRGRGCRECANKITHENQKLTIGEFIKRAKEIHGDKYDYSKVNYINFQIKVNIICNNHDEYYEFQQRPCDHLKGSGCPKCAIKKQVEKQKMSLEKFIERANEIHGIGTYDYSKVKYKNASTKVNIICHKHKELFIFSQTPNHHLNGIGCPKCANEHKNENKKLTLEQFIEQANKVHGIGRYDYSKVEYKNNHTEICIICHKHKKSFKFFQKPRNHLIGKGCPKCNSSKGEILISDFLIKNYINFEEQKRFNDCRYKNPLPFDFYLPQYNLCIEFDGQQHFIPHDFNSKETEEQKLENLKLVQKRDQIKNNYCKEKGINLLRIRYNENIGEKLCEYFQNNKIKILDSEITIFNL